MASIDEKRVYADQSGREVVLVASDLGVTSVSVSADQVGRFALAHRGSARGVAARRGEAAVATDDGVLVTRGEDEFDAVGFENATAVGYGDDLLAADADGRVAAFVDGEWQERGRVGSAVRAIDGDLLAAADGVHRLAGGSLAAAGLDDARDVAAAGPYAATGNGLYRLGNGWLDERDGPAAAVVADAERAHAVVEETLFERADGEWRALDHPEAALVDVAHGREAVYAVSEDGRLLVTVGDGWRTRELGVRGVRGVAVP